MLDTVEKPNAREDPLPPSAELQRRYRFATAFAEVGGVIDQVIEGQVQAYEPGIHLYFSKRLNIRLCYPGIGYLGDALSGSGTDFSREFAWMRALAEGLERYASALLLDDETITATANQLGENAMDVSCLPAASKREREARDPRVVEPLSPDRPIRWVRGYSLIDRCERLVPAGLSHLTSELGNYTIPISTGIAAHTDLRTAIVSAINEVIERDSIALTWLARLSIPRIDISACQSIELRRMIGHVEQSGAVPMFFDATTNIGVPTVYCVTLIDGHPTLSQSVSCATGFDIEALCEKAVRESVACRAGLANGNQDLPEDLGLYDAIHHGALHMGRSELRHAFSFLLDQDSTVSLETLRSNHLPRDPAVQLSFILQALRALNTDVCIVDLTTDDLRECGLWVVRAIIPKLMPLSFVHACRFLGTPRLFEYPEKAGFGRLVESEINPFPQPFA